jgi:hypothetical protein
MCQLYPYKLSIRLSSKLLTLPSGHTRRRRWHPSPHYWPPPLLRVPWLNLRIRNQRHALEIHQYPDTRICAICLPNPVYHDGRVECARKAICG